MLKRFFKNMLLVACWATIVANGIILALVQAVAFLDGDWQLYEEDSRFVVFVVIRLLLAAALRIYIIRTVKVRQKGGETEES